MMFRTVALEPPTWAAMLPQKFSAATTLTPPVEEAGVDAESHAVASRASPAVRIAAAATRVAAITNLALRTPRTYQIVENESRYRIGPING
jgi:hypothetical protein